MVLLTLTLAYIYFPEKGAQQQEKIFFAAIRANSFQLVSHGDRSAFFAAFSLESSGVSSANITLSCSQQKPAGSFCILEHPAATGFDAAGFRRGFEAGLRSFGIEAKKVPPSGIQDCVGASILIPTGVLPAGLEEIISSSNQADSEIVFAGEVSDFAIDSLGQVQKLEQNESAHKMLQQIEISREGLNSNLFSSGYALALSKIYAKQPDSSNASIILVPAFHSQNFTMVAYAPQNASSGYCRLIYEAESAENNRSAGVSQSSRLSKLPALGGSQEIFAGEIPRYFAWVEPASGTGHALYATASNFAGVQLRQKIFEGSIRSGWLGGFELRNISLPGYYIVSIEDQFSRPYAKSLLHVRDLQIQISSAEGSSYYFSATIDGEPVHSQLATVSIEGSNSSMQYPVSSGAFMVAARPSSSESAFIISLLGAKKRIPFAQQRNPLLSYILQFAAPLLFAALLAFLLARRKPKRKYVLRMPDFSPQNEPEIEIPPNDFLRAFEISNSCFGYSRFPIDCGELAVGLRRLCSSKGTLLHLSRQGIEDALLQMQKAGCVVGHAGFYAPACWNLQIEEAANMRIICNMLVQKGCFFRPLRKNLASISASCPFERVHVQICPKNFSKLKLNPASGAREILAFDSQPHLRSFHIWLKSGSQSAARVSLLIKNKRLFPCLSSNLEELL